MSIAQPTPEELLLKAGRGIIQVFKGHDGLRKFGEPIAELNQRAVEYVYMGYTPAFACKQAQRDFAALTKGVKVKLVNQDYRVGKNSAGDPLEDVLHQTFFEKA
jgi:hypothetical protein